MTAAIQFDRLILALTDKQLEAFVRAWAEGKKGYHRVANFSGAGDRGRDVVGYNTASLDEGDWHNFQCKQYGKTLPTANALADIGKVLYYAHCGEFTAPAAFYFVAPRGLNRNLRTLFGNPSKFKRAIIDRWESYCAKTIIDNKHVALSAGLLSFIDAWDFSRVEHVSLDAMLNDPAAKGVMFNWFKVDPGPAPAGVVPNDIQATELPYVSQLLMAYGERDTCAYADPSQLATAPKRVEHLAMQRERFYDADAFSRFYRDNTMEEETQKLRREIYHGIIDEFRSEHPDSLARVDAIMKQAARVQCGGVLGRHALVPIRQGLCHHFVNDGEISWKS